MDTKLRVTDPLFELQRAEIPQTLMQPLAIIEPFDERKDVSAGLVPRVILVVMDQSFFSVLKKLSATARGESATARCPSKGSDQAALSACSSRGRRL